MDEQMYSQQELGDLHRRNQELIIKCLVLLKAVEENPGLLTPERVDQLRGFKAQVEANGDHLIQVDFHLGTNKRLSNYS